MKNGAEMDSKNYYKSLILILGLMLTLITSSCSSTDKGKRKDVRTVKPQKMTLEFHDSRNIKMTNLEQAINYSLTKSNNSYLSLLMSRPNDEEPLLGFSISSVVIGSKETVFIPSNGHRYSVVVLKGDGLLYGATDAYILKPATILLVGESVVRIKLVNTTKKPLSLLVYAQPACTPEELEKHFKLVRIKYKDIVEGVNIKTIREVDKSDDTYQDDIFPKGAGTIPGKVETQVKKLETLKESEKREPTYINKEKEEELIKKQQKSGVMNPQEKEQVTDELKRQKDADTKTDSDKVTE